MLSNHSDVRAPASNSYQFTVRGLLLVMTGAALILRVALSSETVTIGVAFLACSTLGAVLGNRQFRRMVLYSALGGLVGFWLGIAVHIAYWNDVSEFWRELVTKRRWFVFISAVNSILVFFHGAVLGWVVWAVQVILAKANARRERLRAVRKKNSERCQQSRTPDQEAGSD